MDRNGVDEESDEQKYDLHWNYHGSSILNGICGFLDSGCLTDITLSVDNRSIKAHKLVLASCSPYFMQLFKEMENVQHPVIVLQDVAYDDISAIISYMYQGKCIVASNRLQNVLAVAKLLKIRGLCDLSYPQEDSYTNSTVPPLLPKSCLDTKKLYSNNLPDVVNRETLVSTRSDDEEVQQQQQQQQQQKMLKKLRSCESVCIICGKQLSNQYNLRVHLETHQTGYYACQSCSHISRSRDALRKHVSYRHSDSHLLMKKKSQQS